MNVSLFNFTEISPRAKRLTRAKSLWRAMRVFTKTEITDDRPPVVAILDAWNLSAQQICPILVKITAETSSLGESDQQAEAEIDDWISANCHGWWFRQRQMFDEVGYFFQHAESAALFRARFG